MKATMSEKVPVVPAECLLESEYSRHYNPLINSKLQGSACCAC